MWCYEKSVRNEITTTLGLTISLLLSPAIVRGEDFILRFWQRPIVLTPENQDNFIEFYPEVCGKCHEEQYNDWKNSFHNRSVSPGLVAQTGSSLSSVLKNTEFAQSCYFCHAPALEQSEVVSKKENNKNINPIFDVRLKQSGVFCAVCHIREGTVYGPSLNERLKTNTLRAEEAQREHTGLFQSNFFERAEFCAACHQLDNGYRLNGKVLVNTFEEWKNSIYSESNITCQNCHMPQRKHLFRGIHDPEMTRNGIVIEESRGKNSVRVIITNSGAGHFFPTYVTPEVVVRGYVLGENKKMLLGSLKEAFIGRRVNLELTEEFFDTRIAPQRSFTFEYKPEYNCESAECVIEIVVYPDRFYNKFFASMLKAEDEGKKRELIMQAFKETEKSSYILWRSGGK